MRRPFVSSSIRRVAHTVYRAIFCDQGSCRPAVERVEARVLFSGLDGSEVYGLPSDERVPLYSFIGDWSQSNSETWDMDVGGHHWVAPTFGVVQRYRAEYKVGESYPVSITHTGTNRQLGPDYDYRAWIDKDADPAWTSGATSVTGDNYFAIDMNSPALLQKRASQYGTNAAEGKSATLVIPGVDLDIDSDNNNGFTTMERSDAEDVAEAQSSGGKWVPVTSGDTDFDGVADVVDVNGLNHDFVPIKIGLSSNLSQDTGATGKLTLTFDTSLFRVWKKNGKSSRDGSDLITSGQPVSGLTMQPGDIVEYYVEGIAPGASTGSVITAKVDVTGGAYWNGSVTDKVRAIPYELKFTKTYSDQFAGGTSNYLDGHAGSVNDYILMGTRSDDYAYARADFTLTPNITALRNTLRFKFSDNYALARPTQGFSVSGGTVSAWDDASAKLFYNNWQITAGQDQNVDGVLDGSEAAFIDAHKFIVVNQADYNVAGTDLDGIVFGSDPFFNYADAYTKAFADNVPLSIAGAVATTTTIAPNAPGLSHNVGADFGFSSPATVAKYSFAPQTQLARDVAASDAFNTAAQAVLAGNMGSVRSYFTTSGTTSHDFIFDGPVGINFTSGNLHYALGNVGFTNAKFLYSFDYNAAAATYTLTAAPLVSGKVTDLTDYEFTSSESFARIAAIRQAGYGTLGTGGHVFYSEISLGSNITSMSTGTYA